QLQLVRRSINHHCNQVPLVVVDNISRVEYIQPPFNSRPVEQLRPEHARWQQLQSKIRVRHTVAVDLRDQVPIHADRIRLEPTFNCETRGAEAKAQEVIVGDNARAASCAAKSASLRQ